MLPLVMTYSPATVASYTMLPAIEGGLYPPYHQPPPFTMEWSRRRRDGNLLAVGNEQGCIELFHCHDSPSLASASARKPSHLHGEKPETRFQGHTNALFTLKWLYSDSHLVSGSGDQSVRLHDAERLVTVGKYMSSGSIKCIDTAPSSPFIVAAGSRDGVISIWDIREEAAFTPPPDYGGPKAGNWSSQTAAEIIDASASTKYSVTSLVYIDDNLLVSGGDSRGSINYWDMRKTNKPVKRKSPLVTVDSKHAVSPVGRGHGIQSMCVDRLTRSKLLVGQGNGLLSVLNARNPDDEVQTYSGHNNKSFYIKASFSDDGQFIASGSISGAVYVWKVGHSSHYIKELKSHRTEVCDVQWCKNGFRLASCSDDGSVKVWHLNKESDLAGDQRARDLEALKGARELRNTHPVKSVSWVSSPAPVPPHKKSEAAGDSLLNMNLKGGEAASSVGKVGEGNASCTVETAPMGPTVPSALSEKTTVESVTSTSQSTSSSVPAPQGAADDTNGDIENMDPQTPLLSRSNKRRIDQLSATPPPSAATSSAAVSSTTGGARVSGASAAEAAKAVVSTPHNSVKKRKTLLHYFSPPAV